MKSTLITLLLSCVVGLHAQDTVSLSQFVSPPHAARPQVWWHWMNGNISKDGIRKDLLWMHRMGIGGVHLFDAGLDTPQIVPQRIEYMTPAWQDCLRYALHLADSLGMEVTIASAPGWSNTGGPWVTPDDAMKRLTWRDTVVCGGQRKQIQLPAPYTVSGTFQDVPTYIRSRQVPYYRDLYVLATRVPDVEVSMHEMVARVSSPTGRFSLDRLCDGDLNHMDTLKADKKRKRSWIAFELHKPYRIKSLSIATSHRLGGWQISPYTPLKYLECSQDGTHYKKVCNIPHGAAPLQTIDIPDTEARFFRVVCKSNADPIGIAELVLHTTERVNHAEEKGGFAGIIRVNDFATPSTSDATPLADVIDLSACKTSDSTVVWDVPPGRWRIYRFGYSLTGKENHPASPEATGLEVDKLDSAAVRRYMEHYIGTYRQAVGDSMIGQRGISGLLIDSYEAGCATWTPRMREEFARRRGYDLLPWLPALTGEIVESADKTDAFLYDWRTTLAELITQNLYALVQEIAHRHRLTTYFEGMEDRRAFIADGMAVKSCGDIPMAAQWARLAMLNMRDDEFREKQADMRESASVAHIYGRRLVAAESLTAYGPERKDSLAHNFAPAALKPVADMEFASGINRIVLHESPHQPTDTHRPGVGLGVYGQWFSRHETWAEMARPWMDYLARSSYLLQAGRPVVDVAYYYGEEANATALYEKSLPPVPATVAYDLINPHALTALTTVEDSMLVTPSGMRYRLLALDDNARRLSLPMLRRIHQLVGQGIRLCGQPPVACIGTAADTTEFRQLVDHIWHRGRHHVIHTDSVAVALQRLQLQPDVVADDMSHIRFVHRSVGDTEVYWLCNRSQQPIDRTFSFRVTGKQAEIWHPVTAQAQPATYAVGTHATHVSLSLQPAEALFVVFRGRPHTGLRHRAARTDTVGIHPVSTPWTICLPKGWGTPQRLVTDTLHALSRYPRHALDSASLHAVRHFSGTATYRTTLHLPAIYMGNRQVLHLGTVYHVAQVRVNGHDAGICWTAPYEVDVTRLVHPGDNEIEIQVANTWRNRLVGDHFAPADAPHYAFTSFPWSKKATRKLDPSGLLGPVYLIATRGRDNP